ncbi:MAG: hypothetical protein HY238_27695 [Acidobacteria bacterium]|nr:hypothetical protein [Acidobacteriota bacterium]
MLRFVLLPAALMAGAAAAASEEAAPKAEAILDKYLEVTGGKAAYARLTNQVSTGAMEFVGKGIKATLTSYKAKPRKSYNIIEIEGIGKIEQGADGEIAWEKSAIQGPRVKEGEEKAAALRDAAFNAPWREQYTKAELAGAETIGDQACYKLVLTPNEGKPEARYYDKKTNLLVKVTKTVKSPMGEIPAEILLSDYKTVDGILIPHKVTQRAISQEFVIVLDKIQHNVEMPPDRFEPPADVKALAAKAKGAK